MHAAAWNFEFDRSLDLRNAFPSLFWDWKPGELSTSIHARVAPKHISARTNFVRLIQIIVHTTSLFIFSAQRSRQNSMRLGSALTALPRIRDSIFIKSYYTANWHKSRFPDLLSSFLRPQQTTSRHPETLVFSICSALHLAHLKSKSMTTCIIFFLFVLFATTAFASGESGVPSDQLESGSTTYCRLFKGMSRCVDPPIMFDDEDDWCPYHVCGPSYIQAAECPPGDHQAKYKCKVRVTRAPIYKCRGRRTHKSIETPIGCDSDDSEKPNCTGEIRVCACKKRHPRRYVLTPQAKLKDIQCH